MPIIIRSDQFKKSTRSFSLKIQDKIETRLNLFVIDTYNDVLNNHPLHGEYLGCRSINITGDIRLIYREIGENIILLLDIGTHSQLYD
jgi:addiction module RelE/StbE family toxin